MNIKGNTMKWRISIQERNKQTIYIYYQNMCVFCIQYWLKIELWVYFTYLTENTFEYLGWTITSVCVFVWVSNIKGILMQHIRDVRTQIGCDVRWFEHINTQMEHFNDTISSFFFFLLFFTLSLAIKYN